MDRKIKKLLSNYKWLGYELMVCQKIINDHLDIDIMYLESEQVKKQKTLINNYLPRYNLLKQIMIER